MLQLLKERKTEEGTGIPGVRTACLFYKKKHKLYLITHQVSGIVRKQPLRGKPEFPKILSTAPDEAKTRTTRRDLPSEPKGPGEKSTAGVW